MTTPKVKCDKCGYEGEYNSEIVDGLCQDCATIDFYKLIQKFKEEIDEISRGNYLCKKKN